MELYADAARIAALESALPAVPACGRAGAIAELAWHLRERDTRRARSLALEARSLLGDCDAAALEPLAARLALTLAECARLFGEIEDAQRGALRALAAFDAANDEAGCADARFLLARLGREALDEAGLEARGGGVVARCHAAYVAAHADRQSGALERAIASFARVASQAPAHGMVEIALQSELAIAGILARLGDEPAARDAARAVLANARERGWRPLLAAATVSVCGSLLDGGDIADARELLHEARASLACLSPPRRDAALECLLGRVQLAGGDPGLAARTLAEACGLLREQGAGAELAQALLHEARALAASGAVDAATHRAGEALRVSREAGARAAEAQALHALGDLHATHPGPDRTPRSAIAYLRHAAEIADEIGDARGKAALLRDLARAHEASADLGAALAAERKAHAHAASALRARVSDARLAARTAWLRERQRLQDEHARQLQDERARHAAQLRRAQEAGARLRLGAANAAAASELRVIRGDPVA